MTLNSGGTPTMIMTPMERQAGRFMRAPDHTAAESGGAADNTGGNVATGGGATQTGQNNTGDAFDLGSFWSDPASGAGGAPSGGSAATTTPPAGGQTQQQTDPGAAIGARFVEQLGSLAFTPVFNQETATQIADGNLDGVNQAMTGLARDSVRNSVMMSAQLMQAHGQHLIAQMQTMIQEALGSRDSDATLMAEFPQAAKDPAIRPVIQNIFKQSMLHTGNNREKAIALTKSMLQYVGKQAGGELGLGTPPGNPGDNIDAGAQSLVDQLLAR